jgi:4-hydroxyphenylacetate 3-monooxygenase
MSIINGRDFIERLNKMKSEIWFDGEKIKGEISEHPAFKGILKSKASLYDLQNSQDIKDEMTFLLPDNENPIGLSYLQAQNQRGFKKKKKND